jgi:hypothetical protein
VAVEGLLEPEAGQTLLAALEPLAGPADATDIRSGGQRTADALTEVARRHLEGGQLSQAGGVRPQLLVTVDLDSLLGRPGALGVGGEVGWAAVLAPEACRRLACDGAVTRVLVSRHPSEQNHPGHDPSREAHHPIHDPNIEPQPAAQDPGGEQPPAAQDPTRYQQATAHHHSGPAGLAGWLRAALALLPPVLGGAPTQPLEVGRTSRVIPPPNASAWPCVTAAGCSPTVPGRWAGVRPSSAPLAARRPHRPGQSGLVVPGPSSGRPRGRLATATALQRPADRHPTPPTTPPTPPTTTHRRRNRPIGRKQPTADPPSSAARPTMTEPAARQGIGTENLEEAARRLPAPPPHH